MNNRTLVRVNNGKNKEIMYYHELNAFIDYKQCHYIDWLLNFVDLRTLMTTNKWIISIHDETSGKVYDVVYRREVNLTLDPNERSGVLPEYILYRKLYILGKALLKYANNNLTINDTYKYSVSIGYIKKGLLDSNSFHDLGTYYSRVPLNELLSNLFKVRKPLDELF